MAISQWSCKGCGEVGCITHAKNKGMKLNLKLQIIRRLIAADHAKRSPGCVPPSTDIEVELVAGEN